MATLHYRERQDSINRFQYDLHHSIYNNIKSGYTNNVRNIIMNGMNPNRNDFYNGRTMLHIAVFYQKEDIVRMLIREFNVIDNIKDALGRTALHVASSKSNHNILKYIFRPENINIADNFGMTPLLISYKNKNYFSPYYYLLEKGANPFHVANNGFRISERFRREAHNITRGLQEREHATREYIRPINDVIRISPSGILNLQRTLDEVVNFNNDINALQTRLLDEEIEDRIQRSRQNRIYSQQVKPERPPPSVDELPAPFEHIINDYKDMCVDLKKTCPICFLEYNKDTIVVTKCYHHLCNECYKRIDKCHLCRQVFE